MEKDLVIEISKKKMAHLYFRKRVCRCLTSKVISLARLALGIPACDRVDLVRSGHQKIRKTANSFTD